MLRALYDYGIRNGLAIPPGFLQKDIRAYICLTAEGEFLGIEQYKKDTQVCPDIGSLAQSPDKCNPLAEKAEIILGYKEVKSQFYRKILKDCARYAHNMGVCLSALENEQTLCSIRDEAKQRKVKDKEIICFKVAGIPVVRDERVRVWWEAARKRFVKSSDGKNTARSLCLITGNETEPLATVPGVSGLKPVGGENKVPLFCFDKSAYRSYGLEQSANAPVSEEAFCVVKDALNDLLVGSPAMYRREKNRDFNPAAPIFSGMKFLHWYDCQLEPNEDLIHCAFSGFGGDADEEDEEPQLSEEDALAQARQTELQKRAKADQLFEHIGSGAQAPILKSQYYILLISGNKGRAMVRRYEHGSYETLRANLNQWREDLSLSDNLGTGEIRPQKLTRRLQRLVKDQKKVGSELAEQMKKELAGVTPTIVMAILNGTPLPDTVAVRALAYIRSKLLSPEENTVNPNLPDGIACQWLKAWLIRKSRMRKEEAVLTMNYDRDFPNAAYHCGALMAVYADLQRAAMEEVNATIVQRFYASASRTPTLVLGTLERMGAVYLDQLRKKSKHGLANIYEGRLNDIYSFFGKDGFRQLPSALNLEDQSYFALGYRQMCTQMNADKAAAKAVKEEEK